MDAVDPGHAVRKRFDATLWTSFPATASWTSGTSTTSRHRTVSGTRRLAPRPWGALTLRQAVGSPVCWPPIRHLGSGQRLSWRNHSGCTMKGCRIIRRGSSIVAISEFNALRTEIVGIRNTQAALVGPKACYFPMAATRADHAERPSCGTHAVRGTLSDRSSDRCSHDHPTSKGPRYAGRAALWG